MFRITLLFMMMLFASPVLTAQTPNDICTTGFTTQEIIHDGETRQYDLFIPASATLPAPLVMSFHGFGGTPSIQRDIDGWADLADEEGFLVVYPRGTGFPLRWNTGNEGFRFSIADDVGFIEMVLDALSDCYTEVYGSGFSNGGGMVNRLACETADRFVGIGSVAGAYGELRDGCNPVEPVPIIAFHGKTDDVVPYAGTDDGFFTLPPIEMWLAGWAERNTCEPSPQTDTLSDTVDYIQFTDCAEPLVFYTVDNGDHVWFGSESLLMMMSGVDAIDATRTMWTFFQSLNGNT